jgi:sarcosine oxidase, subunit beta
MRPIPHALVERARRSALPEKVDVAIIGGGIMGLAIAYNLARLGLRSVSVIEGSYLASGASGRNGGGLRQQWSTELNIRLMQESMQLCESFASDMGVNVWMRRGGYLFLIRTDSVRQEVEHSIALQNECDVPTRMISPDEANQLVPELDTNDLVAASYNASDAVVFPWPFLWGYAQAACALGVQLHTHTKVTAIERVASDFVLHTSRGSLTAGRVVNAGGAWSPQIAALLGITLPDWPARHEILSTEPLKPFLTPMVSVLESGLYFSQSLRGELVGGITLSEPRAAGIELGSRLKFLEAISTGLLEVMPRLGNIKIVRQWAGPYDLTSDGNPIVGEAPSVPGFFLCCGFMGHGFMMAPVVARYYALHLLGRETHPFFHKWRLGRFGEGALEVEKMIIG